MSNAKGLKVGKQFKVYTIKTGNKQDGSLWGCVNYTEKDANKKVIQKYTLWLNNDQNFIANFPLNKIVELKIESIESVKPRLNEYTTSAGIQVKENVLDISCVVGIVSVVDNNTIPNNNYNTNYNNNNNVNYNTNSNESFGDLNNADPSIDDLDFLG